MELNEKTVAEIKERLLAMQEMIADIEDALSAGEVTGEVTGEVPKEEKVPEVSEVEEVEEVEEAEEAELTLKDIIEREGLNDLSETDLKEILDAYEIKYTAKNKKQSLIEKVAQGILDGVIEVEDADSDTEKEVAKVEDSGEETTLRQEMEAKILEEIESQIENKVLTKKKASEWLKNHFGSGKCVNCPKGCSDDPIECYKAIKIGFVDDEGNVNTMEEAYMRDNAIFCCGVECQPFEDGKVVCEVCGQVYEYDEE